MKKEMLLVAVLVGGYTCEAEINTNTNIEDAKQAVMLNYNILPTEIKSWGLR